MVIKKISENLIFINADIVNQDELKKYIIDEKVKRINTGFQFNLGDLVIVRSIKESMFPINGYYFPLDKDNCYKGTLNPFDTFFGFIKYGYDKNYIKGFSYDYDTSFTNIYHPVYRDTKHFTINALSSNINELLMPSITFNDRPIIIIEPMDEKINNGLLVNLNPIDTFFNLHNTCMEVSKRAVFLINEEKYKELIVKEEFKKIFNNHIIFLFNGTPSIACDIALLYLGILPQHSVGQRELIEESYNNGQEIVSDKKYLKLFRNYIEYLNQVYLNSSYIRLPKDIIASRKKYERMYPGMLHANTRFREEEVRNTMSYIIATYRDYMIYLAKLGNHDFKANLNDMINLIEYDVKDKYPTIKLTFFELQQQYERILKEYLSEVGYNKFINVTKEFNDKQLEKINKKRIG